MATNPSDFDRTIYEQPAFQGLMQEIVDMPDETELRLIAADWLQDNGDPEWAEFIRLQIEAKRPLACYELLLQHWQKWASLHGFLPLTFPDGPADEGQSAMTIQVALPMFRGAYITNRRANLLFKQGFLSHVIVPGFSTWLHHGQLLIRNYPLTFVTSAQFAPYSRRNWIRIQSYPQANPSTAEAGLSPSVPWEIFKLLDTSGARFENGEVVRLTWYDTPMDTVVQLVSDACLKYAWQKASADPVAYPRS